MSPAARALLFAVRVYQAFFSGLMPSACKFYPSCSHYTAEALRLHGARRGTWLVLRRLARCHPFTPGGVDLVPSAIEIPNQATRTGLPAGKAGFGLPGFSADASQPTKADACPTPRTEVCVTEEVHS
jgi:uncharacterized protein